MFFGVCLICYQFEVGLLEQVLVNEFGLDVVQIILWIVVNVDSFVIWILLVLMLLFDVSFDIVVDDQDNIVDWLWCGIVSVVVLVDFVLVMGCDSILLGVLCYCVIVLFVFVVWYLFGN